MKVQGAYDPAAYASVGANEFNRLKRGAASPGSESSLSDERDVLNVVSEGITAHDGAVRSGAARSLVRLETSRRFQTNVDERHVVKRDVMNAPRPTNIRDHRVSDDHRKLARWQSGPASPFYITSTNGFVQSTVGKRIFLNVGRRCRI